MPLLLGKRISSNVTTTLRPRCNMVGFHFLYLKMLAANRADTFLLFVLTTLGVTVKRELADGNFFVILFSWDFWGFSK